MQVLSSGEEENNQFVSLNLSADETIQVYPNSINRHEGAFLSMAGRGLEKHLYVVSFDGDKSISTCQKHYLNVYG